MEPIVVEAVFDGRGVTEQVVPVDPVAAAFEQFAAVVAEDRSRMQRRINELEFELSELRKGS